MLPRKQETLRKSGSAASHEPKRKKETVDARPEALGVSRSSS